jgi:hypothetical protein
VLKNKGLTVVFFASFFAENTTYKLLQTNIKDFSFAEKRDLQSFCYPFANKKVLFFSSLQKICLQICLQERKL